MSRILNWLTWRQWRARDRAEAKTEAGTHQANIVSGKYRSLHTYLTTRYTDRVVMTFAEIEDLLGFALPDPARLRQDWWTSDGAAAGESGPRDAWALAKRTAKVNLSAQTVVFDRAS